MTSAFVSVWVILVGALVALPGQAVDAATPRPIVFAASESSQTDTDGLFRVERDGSGLQRLTSSMGDDNPVLSPDGTTIVFEGDRSGQGLFAVAATGGDVRRLTDGVEDHTPTWHPDGDRVYFVRGFDAEDAFIMSVPIAGGDPTLFHDEPGVVEDGIDVTADGTEVGFVLSDDQGNTAFRLVDMDGNARTVRFDSLSIQSANLDFHPNGDWVDALLQSGCGIGFCVYERRLVVLGTENIIEAPTAETPDFNMDGAISPSGDAIASFDFDPDNGFFVYVAPIGADRYNKITPAFQNYGGIDWGAFGDGSDGDAGGGTPPGPSADTDRLEGDSRFSTAAAIARSAFPGGAPVVYLARADVVVDAVAGGSLTDGPILLVESCGPVPGATGSALQELAPATVVALGGEAAICSGTLAEAGAVAGADRTDRLQGDSRYGTAAAISERAFPDGAPVVHLARADVVVDAVAGGVLTPGPVLLVPQCGSIPTIVERALRDLAPAKVVALGGLAAICDEVVDRAEAVSGAGSSGRYAGDSRYGTAVEIARAEFGGRSVDRVYLARGDVYVDAVAGGVLTDGPILLVPSCGALPTVVADALGDFGPDRVTALGGTAAVCDEMLDAAGRAAA